MSARREFRPVYEVCAGVGTQADVLFTSDDADESIEWARQHYRVHGDRKLVVRFDEFQPESGLFRPRIVWRARNGLADAGPATQIRSSLTGRILHETRRQRR
jgi:hypothetical protein